ncbi:hypothetical protein PIB30_092628 [Stylosanthes scabra]|uniref:Uncharacterized protein n=1 Tax=Stylosanthes scabra TaxID=79078 RepID=A0ABU6RVG2_9FABA|nr:hypothetical protein [Stylosanthes scabra]
MRKKKILKSYPKKNLKIYGTSQNPLLAARKEVMTKEMIHISGIMMATFSIGRMQSHLKPLLGVTPNHLQQQTRCRNVFPTAQRTVQFSRQMKKGSLQSKKQNVEAKQSKNSTHMRGSPSFPRIGVEVHAYAWKAHSSHVPESRLAKPKCDQDFSKPKSATHRRRSPRICVGSQQLTFEAHVGRAKRDPILASPF